MRDAIDIKGLWNGSYRYSASEEIGATPFKARLAYSDGVLSGVILEVHLHKDSDIRAKIEGIFDGKRVQFTKQYLEAGLEYQRAVEYQGEVDEDGCMITGTWSLPDDSGTFEMRRAE